MRNKKGGIRLGTIIGFIVMIIILAVCFNIHKKNYFNGFTKAVEKQDKETIFIRDSEVKYSKHRSYKIQNVDYNDATIYKEIEVEPNTPYRISCMVKTDNVICKTENSNGGVSIGLLDTTEYSEPITGTNDWQYMEFMFNSKNREKVKISFRIGGNQDDCIGTAWFSDFKLEKGLPNSDYDWDMGCFIINQLDVNIDDKQYAFEINKTDIENVQSNLERYKKDCYELSGGKMNVNYEIVEIYDPVTTISYSEEHGYYVSYLDVKNLIYDTVKEKEYDHIFVVCRMEDEEGNISIPIIDNWIGLGSMDMYGIGYSLIRINSNSNSHTFRYGISNRRPEEVYLHEFCHTLERNLEEFGYDIPALHDYEKYGYTEETAIGLYEWYKDYMSKNILDESTGKYIGLDEFCYMTQPANSDNFEYPIEEEFNHEPQNIIEEILTIFDALEK